MLAAKLPIEVCSTGGTDRFPSLHVTIWPMQTIETIVLGEQQPFEKSSDFRGAVFARLPC
jgi:hypothetical protein